MKRNGNRDVDIRANIFLLIIVTWLLVNQIFLNIGIDSVIKDVIYCGFIVVASVFLFDTMRKPPKLNKASKVIIFLTVLVGLLIIFTWLI